MKKENELPEEVLKRIGEKAKKEGKDKLTDEEIDEEIKAYRREKRQRTGEPVKTRN